MWQKVLFRCCAPVRPCPCLPQWALGFVSSFVLACSGLADVVWSGAEGLRPFCHPSHDMARVRIEDGELRFDVAGWDAQITAQLPAPLAVGHDEVVYFTARCEVSGNGEIFWQPAGGKMSERDKVLVPLVGDGAWHTYRVCPAWGSAKAISAIRFDFPGVATGTAGAVRELRIASEPALATSAAEADGVLFELKTERQEYRTLVWSSDELDGPQSATFATMPDGLVHTYYLNLKGWNSRRLYGRGVSIWRGKIGGLRLTSQFSGKEFRQANLRVVKGTPDLPADPVIVYVGPESAIPRAGRPLALEVFVRNLGTRPVKSLRLAVEGLGDLRVLGGLEPEGGLEAFDGLGTCGDDFAVQGTRGERRFRVTLADPGRAMKVKGTLVLTADGGIVRRCPFEIGVGESLGLAPCSYPPEPKPVKTGDFKIGAFLFPTWATDSSHAWNSVWTRAPWRKPVLGWYDEKLPEVKDWQIKYLVENGVSYVIVDWYWRPLVGIQGDQTWMKSFKACRYAKYLKWAVMWCNAHGGHKEHSEADMGIITKYWCERCFNDPQYLKVDGKPVVVLYNALKINRDLGEGATKRLLDISRDIARRHGHKGIYFVSQTGDRDDATFLKQFPDNGVDAICTYHYSGNWTPRESPKTDGVGDYAHLVKTGPEHWRELYRNSQRGRRPAFWPSLSTSYDDRPWRGEKAHPIANYTPENFRKVCESAKKFGEETGVKMLLTGALDEWGEGEIGYPNHEHGFGILEAIRETFGEKPPEGWPVNYAPEDVGLGAYDTEEALRSLRN